MLAVLMRGRLRLGVQDQGERGQEKKNPLRQEPSGIPKKEEGAVTVHNKNKNSVPRSIARLRAL